MDDKADDPFSPEASMQTQRASARSRVYTSGSVASHRSMVGSVKDVVEDIQVLLDAELGEEITKPISTMAVVFNLANTTMGVGILSLASAFYYGGLVLGPLLMVACAVATYFSVLLLVDVIASKRVPADSSGVPSLEGIAEFCLGAPGRVWVQSVLILICMGTLVAYLVAVKSLFYNGINQILPDSTMTKLKDYQFSKQTCMVLSLLLIAFPLSLLRRLDGLWFTSCLSVVSLLYFVCVCRIALFAKSAAIRRTPPTHTQLSIYYYGEHTSVSDMPHCHDNGKVVETLSTSQLLMPTSVPDAFQAFSIISVSYICQLTVIPILKELAKGQEGGGSSAPVKHASKQLMRATWITMIIACTFYLMAGTVGYLTWRTITATPSTILACYPPDQASVVLVYFGMTSVLLFSFPLICFTCRCTLVALVLGDRAPPLSTPTHFFATVALCVPVCAAAYFAETLTSVLAVVSTITSPSLCFLLPGVLFLKAGSMERARAAGSEGGGGCGADAVSSSDEEAAAPVYTSAGVVGTRGSERVNSATFLAPVVHSETSPLVDGGGGDTLEAAEYVEDARRTLRERAAGGWVVTVLGIFMQIMSIVGCAFTIAGTGGSSSSDSVGTPAPNATEEWF